MRTLAPILAVFALAVAVTLINVSGFAAAWGAPAPESPAAQEQLENNSKQLNPNKQPVEGKVTGNRNTVVGLIVGGGRTVVHFAGAALALPATLSQLGFPIWFAKTFGWLTTIVAGFGFVQFFTGRTWD